MLFFGRHENHIRKRPFSLRTAASKQVPRSPPNTGFAAYFCQPPAVSVSASNAVPPDGSDCPCATLLPTAVSRSNPNTLRKVLTHRLLSPYSTLRIEEIDI